MHRAARSGADDAAKALGRVSPEHRNERADALIRPHAIDPFICPFVLCVLVLFGGCETRPNPDHVVAKVPVADVGPDTKPIDGSIKQLESPEIEVRTQAARHLGELGDERALPALIAALRAATSPYLGIGGTEQTIPVRKYRKELVASIGKLTGLPFDFPGEPDRYGDHPPPSYDEPRRLNAVIGASEAWMDRTRGNARSTTGALSR